VASNATSSILAPPDDDPVIVPDDEPVDGTGDPDPVRDIIDDATGEGPVSVSSLPYTQYLEEERKELDFTVEQYEFSDFDYRDDDNDRKFSLTTPVKKLIGKAMDVAVDLSQLIDLIRIQLNESEQRPADLFIRTIGGITLSISAGLATLVTRSSAIAAGLMSSVSVMKGFDPLLVMKSVKQGRGGRDNEMDEAVDNLFDDTGEAKNGNKES
jgi:hypothetical protein